MLSISETWINLYGTFFFFFFFFFYYYYGAIAHIEPWPPLLRVSVFKHVVGLLWTSDQSVAKVSANKG
jgi:hypothetical protein